MFCLTYNASKNLWSDFSALGFLIGTDGPGNIGLLSVNTSGVEIMGWLHTAMYTRLLINVTKQMKKSPIWRCTFLHQYLIIKKPTTPSNHFIAQWVDIFKFQMSIGEMRTAPFSVFLFDSNPQFFSLQSSHFLLHLGTHQSKTGLELIYYHLYHEEASF